MFGSIVLVLAVRSEKQEISCWQLVVRKEKFPVSWMNLFNKINGEIVS
jgi:hypothetical protein